MNEPIQKSTLADEGVSNLISQFKDKPSLEALARALLDQVQLVEDGAFTVYNGTKLADAEGTQLDGIGQVVGELRKGRSDSEYREGLASKILQNLCEGTTEDVISVVRSILGSLSLFQVLEFLTDPALFLVSVPEEITGVTAELLAQVLSSSSPAGVRMILEWYQATPAFTMGDAGSPSSGNEGFGDAGDLSKGGKMTGALSNG